MKLQLPIVLLMILGANLAHAKQVKLDVAMAHPVMLTTEGKAKAENHLRIGLTGFELSSDKERKPVNVAIVIDKSGSMQGDKIEQARQAAMQAVDRLRDADIVSVVVYDSSVEVIVPATKAMDRREIKEKIRRIVASGNTALFAGVSKGASEVRKFIDDKRVNRVILLSDGLANVGPASPSELEQLGTSLIKEGISVTTMGLGLGYNEDLMTKLAMASSGNHVFIEDAENLARVFQNEFDDVLSVVAQKIHLVAKLSAGIRPVKVLNYPAEISGQTVAIDLGQLYARQERYFVIEVEVPLGSSGSKRPVADVTAEYANMITETTDRLASSVEVRFTDNEKAAEEAINKDVLAACVIQVANERNRMATQMRDAGEIEAAKKELESNAKYLDKYFHKLGVRELEERKLRNSIQAENLSPEKWNAGRKLMLEQQFGDSVQQSYSGRGPK